MEDDIKEFRRNSITSSNASLKVRPTDNLLSDDQRQSIATKRKGSKQLVRSFDNNKDEDDVSVEKSSYLNFEEDEDKDEVSSSSYEYMNSEEEMI